MITCVTTKLTRLMLSVKRKLKHYFSSNTGKVNCYKKSINKVNPLHLQIPLYKLIDFYPP